MPIQPIGNLYTDAARWYTNADVAFITSGGVRGPGWPAGEVTVSDIWAALPFPNNLCTGYINGVHLFQLLNYSMSVATFEGHDTDDGGRMLSCCVAVALCGTTGGRGVFK